MDVSWETSNFLRGVDDLPRDLVQILQNGTNAEYLNALSLAALKPRLTGPVFVYLQPLALDICARWVGRTPHAVAAALGGVLDLLPYLSEVAQRLLWSFPELDLLDGLEQEDPSESDLTRAALLAIFRLLCFDNSKFAHFIRPARLQVLIRHDDRSIRYLSIRIMCQYMHASDAIFEQMIARYLGKEAAPGKWEDRVIDYHFLTLWEEKRLKDLQKTLDSMRPVTTVRPLSSHVSRIIASSDIHASVSQVAGVLLLRSKTKSIGISHPRPLVLTDTTTSNLGVIAEGLRGAQPLLLTGLAGCGKTSLVKHVAELLDQASKMITLHLNEQSDAKLLIGIYTTADQPGSFRWQPGVLTTAVMEGRWVVIEDLDRAPNEIISTLLPLIERGELLIPSRAEKLQASAGFKIIATMRSTNNLDGQIVTPGLNRLLGRRLWKHIPLEQVPSEELQQIINSRYPILSGCLPRIMAVFQSLMLVTSGELRTSASQQLRSRPISSRELFKWVGRIDVALKGSGVRTGNEAFPESVLDTMFLDALDCFVNHLENETVRKFMIFEIAKQLHVDPKRRDHLVNERIISMEELPAASRSLERIKVGRTSIRKTGNISRQKKRSESSFVLNHHSLKILEQVSAAIRQKEPLLLVGETGIGKTAAIQYLSQLTEQDLVAINLSQQSESSDMLGGFKPVNLRSLAIPLKDQFDALFDTMFSKKRNAEFSAQLSKVIGKSQWKRAVSLWRAALQSITKQKSNMDESSPLESSIGEQRTKRRKIESPSGESLSGVERFREELDTFERKLAGPSNAFRFAFAEGNLVEAVREGHWVLLDEINLASSDTLECLSDLLDSGPDAKPFLVLTEAGNVERIMAHPNFRIFAAMNPASEVGKKDLPIGIRSRFTEIYVDSPDRDARSLEPIVRHYLRSTGMDARLPTVVTDIYQSIQRLVVDEGLVDGSGQKPHFSLRTLTRALSHAILVVSQCSIQRALYEGFCMCFLTMLDSASEAKVQNIVQSGLLGEPKIARAHLRKALRAPPKAERYIEVILRIEALAKTQRIQEERHWVPKGKESVEDPVRYIITPYVAHNLRNLIRATSGRKHPVLIQGPTSAGKTSMVEYLAARSGNRFLRINNHEHTDLQEYLGTYVSTSSGQLVFQEGVLVKALREGHWVVLDELNLAPTDVLEALNRLLDDNRELLIPETQEVIKPHPDFMLFATQNPAGPYGGRKTLSRAFRNRFIELHFDDIPVNELNVILARRSNLPESWCALIVEVYKQLSSLRQEQRLFEQNSFATLRDLFRWAFRGADTLEQLAHNGYMLLAEKVRKQEERANVREAIESVMSRKGVKIRIQEDVLYSVQTCVEMTLYDQNGSGVIWTKAMRRLYSLVSHAIRNKEPVLLVGDTGCGKTTVCQMLAQALQKRLHIVNAHQNTETGDLIGAQRPIRNRAAIENDLLTDLQTWRDHYQAGRVLKMDTDGLLAAFDQQTIEETSSLPLSLISRIATNRRKQKALFEWADGSLVQAMRAGEYYLLDEISLADDSVLERMNSVLDPQRSILLAEKGSDDPLVVAAEDFQFLATMNPGGDFGKKELSPALRNRFTEIWVPPLSDTEDLLLIAEAKLSSEVRPHASSMVAFSKWFGERYQPLKTSSISIRDILAWVEFANNSSLSPLEAVIHGACLVYIDTLGANPSALLAMGSRSLETERKVCFENLETLVQCSTEEISEEVVEVEQSTSSLRVGNFVISSLDGAAIDAAFNFEAPTVKKNVMRILRALQVQKPILLEGNPGVGKTSIIVALAKATGRNLIRINLSEQTDLMDLFGSDVPVENGDAGSFAWKDAPYLQAMKRGDWVLLDEMNLASQSVLEGLNACLDHRGEVYISELDQTFTRHVNFKLFAAQNPHHQGGGRKGLPASFVNRFTVVYADVYRQVDLEMISSRLFPSGAHTDQVRRAISFVAELDEQVVHQQRFGAKGAPWEFNLRDTLRWLQLLTSSTGLLPAGSAKDFLDVLFVQRFRSVDDSNYLRALFESHFEQKLDDRKYHLNLSPTCFQVGLGLLTRSALLTHVAPVRGFNMSGMLPIFESLMICIQQSWPVILVGATGAGKTATLNALASLTGVELETFALNADIDATDLVGGYEQADASRSRQSFLTSLSRYCREEAVKHLVGQQEGVEATEASTCLLEIIAYLTDLATSTTSMEPLAQALERFTALSPSPQAKVMVARCRHSLTVSRHVQMAKFEWIDGILVRALAEGKWLVLDNANLCSSSVLDRLNSLLEPNGALIVNEHCNEDGNPKIVRPHPNFRIFLTMDPQYGEMSRAMRNRAVELHISSPAPRPVVQASSHVHPESSIARFRQLIATCSSPSIEEDLELAASVTQAALGSLFFEDLQLFPGFLQESQVGLMSLAAHYTVATAATQFEAVFALDASSVAPTMAMYDRIGHRLTGPVGFANNQPLHPLANTQLAQYANARSHQPSPQWIAKLYNLSFMIIDMRVKIEEVKTIQASSVSAMTRLERSFAANRIPHIAKDSTHQVGPFLEYVLTVILDWLGAQQIQQSEDWTSTQFTESLARLWWHLYEMTNSNGFDEALFQTNLSIWNDFVSRPPIPHLSTPNLVSIVANGVQKLSTSASLTTGLSMEILWKNFKPAVPPTFNRCRALMQLKALADRFHKVVWQIQAPNSSLLALHRSLKDACNRAITLDCDLKPLIQELETAIENLHTSEDPKMAVRPFFSSLFDALSRLSILCSSESDYRDVLEMLACKTYELGPPRQDTQDLATRLERTSISFQEEIEADGTTLREDRLPLELVRRLEDIDEVDLRRLDLLQMEMVQLGKTVSKDSKNFSFDIPRILLEFLYQLIAKLAEIHQDKAKAPLPGSLSALIEEAAGVRKDLQTLSREPVGMSEMWQLTGQYFVTTACVYLLLYVPNKPFDPALRSRVARTFHEKRKESLEREIVVLSRLEKLSLGDTTSLRRAFHEIELTALGPPPNAYNVGRPPKSQLTDLQVEFDTLLRVVKTIRQDHVPGETPSAQHTVWMENLQKIAVRLRDGFPDYLDIVSPAISFIRLLRMGLLFNKRACVADGEKPMSSDFQDPSDLRIIPLSGLPLATGPVKGSYAGGSSSNVALDVHKFIASAISPALWPQKSLSQVVDEFDRLHGRWQLQIEKEKKKYETMSSLYKHKGGVEETDEALEREFNILFPEFGEEEAQPIEEYQFDSLASASYAADAHISIFFSPTDPESQMESLMKQMVRAMSGVHDAQGQSWQGILSNEESRSEKILPALFLLLKERHDLLLSDRRIGDAYNIYMDPNIPQMKRTAAMIYRIQDRFQVLVLAWPEHSTLRNVLETCKQLLTFQHTVPLMKILPKLEQLHAHVYEWQTVASREFSAAEILSVLTELIVSWRQLELSTWAKLLDLEDKRCADEAKSFWFLAYGNISLPDMAMHSAQLLDVLQGLLSTSPVGQYPHRIRMLRSLVRQLEITGPYGTSGLPQSSLAAALSKFCDYFSRFESSVAETISKRRNDLEKALKEVLQLATWKDRNIESLRQSAKSSHRKLFRIVKKYRILLNKPVASLLRAEAPPPTILGGADAVVKTVVRESVNQVAFDLAKSNKDLWSSRPMRFQNIAATTSMINSKVSLEQGYLDASVKLEDLIDSLEGSISDLQKATPSVLTEENTNMVKHLTARKRRVFADLLKDLRQMGLKNNPTIDSLARQNSLAGVLSSMSARAADLKKVMQIQEAEDALYRTLDLMDDVRRSSKEHHEDLTAGDIARCVGFAESIFATCLQQHDMLAKNLESLSSLNGSIQQVKNMWTSGGPRVQREKAGFLYESRSAETRVTWIPTIMRVAAKVLTAQAELGSLDFHDVVDGLRQAACQYDSLLQQFRNLPQVPRGLSSIDHVDLTKDSYELLSSSTQDLTHWAQAFPQAKVTIDHVLHWTEVQTGSIQIEASNGVPKVSLEDFERSQFNALDSILGSVQDVAKAIEFCQYAEEDKDWLVHAMRNKGLTMDAFHVSNVIALIDDLLLQLNRLEDDRIDSLEAAAASLAVALPLLQQYQCGVQEAVNQYATLHRATCRAAYRLTKSFTILASQGYCRPAEKSNEKNSANEKLESGTGLGEGEGAEDISKDVGDDEDLQDLAQDENNQKKESGIENEDDAIDVEHSLEGKAGEEKEVDAGEAENKDGIESEDDGDAKSETGSVGGGVDGAEAEGAEAVEEEVGQVDDLGPSTVDEKMWDEAGDDDAQEKKGMQRSKDTNGDDDAAAGEKGKDEDAEDDGEQAEGVPDGIDQDSELSISDAGDDTAAGQKEAMDPHVKETEEGLDLPDDMQLDGEKGDHGTEDDQLDEELLNEHDATNESDELDRDRLPDGKVEEAVDAESKEVNPADQQDDQSMADEASQGEERDQGDFEKPQDKTYGNDDTPDQTDEPGTGASTGRVEQAEDDDAPPEAQGVGAEDAPDDQDTSSSSVKQLSGTESQSAPTTQAETSDFAQAKSEPVAQGNRDQQAVKKLGDVLEKWHRQQREIRPASDQQEQEPPKEGDADMTGAEFEHLPDEDADADTQALGGATKDQAKTLDDSMASDMDHREEQNLPNDVNPDAGIEDYEQSEGEDIEMEGQSAETIENQQQQKEQQASSFIGQRQEQLMTVDEQPQPEESHDRDDEMSDALTPPTLSEDLTTMSLTTRPSTPRTSDPTALWHAYVSSTHALSQILTEQLRLILAPTLATKLRGDFRTGKRLNIKRIIPYIASSYRRDKIWMRRSVPSKRAYQVMLAIDDSGSMGERIANDKHNATTSLGSESASGGGRDKQATRADLAFSTLTLLTTSLTALEIPAISVLGFGAEPFIAHPFSHPFTSSSGPEVLSQFSFSQRQTDVRKLVATAIEQFAEARITGAGAGGGSEELWQLMLIVGDGICEDHEAIRRELVRAREERILVVFVVVDDVAAPSPSSAAAVARVGTGAGAGAGAGKSGAAGGQSIMDLEKVEFVQTVTAEGEEGEMKIERRKYLETFPFEYYLVVRNVTELPGVLATALRQWFAEVAER